jgi:hypothetical protein
MRIARSIIVLIAAAVLAGAQPSPSPFASDASAAAADELAEKAESLYLAAVKTAKDADDLKNPKSQRAALDALEAALKAGACSGRALADAAFADLHVTQRFRNLMRDHARLSEITLTIPNEPGDKLRVTGVVRDSSGKPIAGALVGAYHTDAKGIYSEQGSAAPRLFGYMRTDAEGRFAFNTIRPASYPGRPHEFDQHIHYVVSAPGYRERQTANSFADDPHWKGKTIPDDALKVTKDERGVDCCAFEIVIERSR